MLGNVWILDYKDMLGNAEEGRGEKGCKIVSGALGHTTRTH